MTIGRLEINTGKFAQNAAVLGKFALNYGAHVAGTAVIGSYVVNHVTVGSILLGAGAMIGLGLNCHRINLKIAKEAQEKEVPISKVLNPEITLKKSKKRR